MYHDELQINSSCSVQVRLNRPYTVIVIREPSYQCMFRYHLNTHDFTKGKAITFFVSRIEGFDPGIRIQLFCLVNALKIHVLSR